ncbi:putative protein phosphatase 2C 5 [Carex littledalei]|uniref:protein-serine/threonine phosphatase n=1 Tax=Carex littledalei TaxID=544730 RepID=A0A833QHA5_9POAL|nr:putative protein phosphatase 2C 5 [Carex littledalei]
MALLSAPRLLPLGSGGGRISFSKVGIRCAATIAASDAAVSEVARLRWGSTKQQGPRSEMEDDVIIRSDGLADFSFAAVFDGHAGFSTVRFLRDELYKECSLALQGGSVLNSKNFDAIKDAIQLAFVNVDSRLLNWLQQFETEDASGATATVMFIRNDLLIVSHLGDSAAVMSRGGRTEVVTNPHRPYGNNRVSLQEIKRIRAAGGWISDGRICGEISVSRAFGDIQFKTKKNEMLARGVEDGRWTEKFASRIQFKGDLLTASPDIYITELGPNAEFILLASDGLWDYMKTSDAVALVRNQLRQHGDVQLACEALAQTTLNQGSQDNISVVIADLGRTKWDELPLQGSNLLLELGQAFATVGIVSIGIWVSLLYAS